MAAAALQSFTCSSPVSRSSPQHSRPRAGIFSRAIAQHPHSSFNGLQLNLQRLKWTSHRSSSKAVEPIMMSVTPKIQFIQGIDERTIPEVRLTKSKDGTNGVATFKFDQPSVFDSSSEVGDITGFYMIDDEGVISSNIVNARFVNGKPAGIEAKYIMRSPREWDRFMRFMERYSNANGLQFVKS